MRVKTFIYRLFFTREDDLDVLQLLFLVWVVFIAYIVWKVGIGAWTIPTAAYSLIGAVFATLAIAGTPVWVAKLLAKSKAPSEVASAIASAREYGPSTEPFDTDA